MKIVYARVRQLLLVPLVISTLSSCSTQPDPKATVISELIAKSVREYASRTRYQKLDVPTLNGIADDRLEQAIVDYVDYKVGGDYASERKIVDGPSPGIRALYITWRLEAEVGNGGFNQYFWNSAGQFADSAINSFEFFNAIEHAAVVREALAVRQAEAQLMAEFKRDGTIEAFSKSYKHSKLAPVDQKFFATNEKLSALRIAKIRSQVELFVGD